MESKTIYFDESGNTGTELLDRHQTYFSTGSTDIAEVEAAEIIAQCFPRSQSSELKSGSILKRSTGRRGFLVFAEEVARQPQRYFGTIIDKRFAVLCKMVDFLVEPPLYDAGYDFYVNDYAARYANMAYFAFENLLDADISTAIYRTYNDFARSPDLDNLGRLRLSLEHAQEKGTHGTETVLDMMIEGVKRLEQSEIGLVPDTNDIHVTSLLSSMSHWQSRHSGPFSVVHDESTHFFARSSRWEEMTDPAQPRQIIDVGSKRLTLPISVISTTSARSHECPSLQLCDLVAGFVSRVRSSKDQGFLGFAQTALEAGLNCITVFPVEAGTDFVDGPPALADGPDAVDRIRMGIAAVRQERDGPT